MCHFLSGGAARLPDAYVSNFYATIVARYRRGACSSICVKFLSGRGAAHVAPYASISL
ncbi:MAG TPA: hypothetical protein PLI57_03355 [Spirochaetota bacterium]|nr:hypothetical protein [Spirochaetota bacterium]